MDFHHSRFELFECYTMGGCAGSDDNFVYLPETSSNVAGKSVRLKFLVHKRIIITNDIRQKIIDS